MLTTQEVASRYMELARQEKWFEIQEELFADDVKSVEPVNSPYLKAAEGKSDVKKKGQAFVSRIEALHKAITSDPIVAGKHFVVRREKDMTVAELGRIQFDQLMVYEVKDGKIILEQFFY
jgi:hypothetical protein